MLDNVYLTPLKKCCVLLRRGARVVSRACYTHLSGATLCLYPAKSLAKEEAWELWFTQASSPTHGLLPISLFAWGAIRGALLCNKGTDALQVTSVREAAQPAL